MPRSADVVINCRFLTHPITGVERFAHEITSRLVALTASVTLVAPRSVAPGTRVGGVEVQRIGRLEGHAWEQVSLPRYLRSVGKPTLIDLANTGPILWRKQLYTLHDIAFVTHPESYRRSFRLAYRLIAGSLVRRAAHVATVSEFSRDEILRVFSRRGAPIDIVPNAPTARSPSGGDRPPALRGLGDQRYLLAVGSAAKHKNTARLVEAYGRMRMHLDAPPQLVIVGGGSKGFNTDHTGTGVPGVIDAGRVSDEDLARLYTHATAFVYPSLYEGFGIPPLEAQAAGTPVIVSRRRPFTDILPESSAVWCDPEDASSIARAMEAVATSSELRREIVKEGSMNAARYSWDESARRALRIITG